jgi:PAS domain S-box-containing protein
MSQDTRPSSESPGSTSGVLGTVLTILLFAGAFCVVQRLTFMLRFPPFHRTTIWTPGALFFSALLLAPLRRWWVLVVGLCLGVFAGYYEDDVVTVATAMLSVPFFCVTVGLGAWGVRRFGANPLFGNLNSLTVYVLIAVVLVPVLTQAPEDVVRFVSGADDVWAVSLRSVLCMALGTLIATPALTLTLAHGRSWLRESSRKQFAEIAVLVAGLVAVGHISFWMSFGDEPLPALLYAPLPLLLWAALRFELAGVSWALLLLAIQSTWGATRGRGPFASQAPADNVLQLQFFLLAISLPLMFLATVIRERRQVALALAEAEQEVRREYAQLAAIYQTAPVGLGFVDTQLRYVSVNDHLAELHGIPAVAHFRRTVSQVLPHLAGAIEPIYRRVIETGQPVVDIEVQSTTASRPGVKRTWLANRYPVKDLQGTVLGVMTVVQEITDRKQADEARQELAHAARLTIVGELTASIAHEINQPLGAILSNADAAETLLESSPAPLDEVRQILHDIRKDDLRASEVIRRIRTLLRNRAIEIQPVDLNEVISEVLGLIQADSGRRGVVLEAVLAGDLPLVPGDKVHLQQVLLNLVFNGMEAMAEVPGERRLGVRTSRKDNGLAEIAVSDNGPGILPDQLPRLFDPFFSTKKQGMGLGLSIARSLVEAHGGQICAENNPAGGATVRFTLPIASEQPNPEIRGTLNAPSRVCV